MTVDETRTVVVNAADEAVFEAVRRELMRAREKFPEPNRTCMALGEETGELFRAVLHATSTDEPTPYAQADVGKEAVQVIAMAVRILTEGDLSNRLQPGAIDEYASIEEYSALGKAELAGLADENPDEDPRR